MSAYDTLVARALPVKAHPGSTSYFGMTERILDPSLFSGLSIRPSVRTAILGTLYHFWETKYANPHKWSTVWIAGSGASYQWAAERSPSDLDVLIGVDFYEFRSANPDYMGLGDVEISNYMDDQFRNELDPHTAHTVFNGSVYEATFYVNPGSHDIRDIVPYAAYDLSHNEWTVYPDPAAKAPFNREYTEKARADRDKGRGILKEYNQALREVKKAKDDPTRLNAESWLKNATEQGANLFDEIHEGRHKAFRSGGTGYSDWANYRWQAGKKNGLVPALQNLKALKKNAMDATQTQLYGAPIMDHEHALIKAALWKAGQ